MLEIGGWRHLYLFTALDDMDDWGMDLGDFVFESSSFFRAEAEDFVPPPPVIAREQPKSPWEDEDQGEEEVKESWEEEDKPAASAASCHLPIPGQCGLVLGPDYLTISTYEFSISVIVPGLRTFCVSRDQKLLVPSVVTKPKKKEEKKGKKVAVSLDEGKLTDPLAEKLRQQRLVEEADYQSTTELFGRQKNPDQTLENFIPKSEEDFQDYAELIANKLRPFEKSFHYMTLLKAVMKHAVTSLNAADAKVLASSLTVTANEKLKAEKDASGKKKTGAKKKQLHVDKAEDDGFATGNYDDVDDYDFM
ncbi:hypothetical protein AXG93_2960s1180 [Marchantia polymorpha subsp. ruderalis]|uniref:Uncharacterized protein n=1 Tax=Marchantia polymorpha subsp. ruderalis TaxID=1480154 RepID=A0A176W8K1_MARPO|nr:hypothetical protein AXG93_2960s1180 [Marchantia polymorpha subsp. ruderalis]